MTGPSRSACGKHPALAQGLINTLSKVQPRLFWLVPSAHPDSTEIAELVRELAPNGFCFQPWNTSTRYCSIAEPDDLFVCRSTLRQVIACARKFLERGERLLVNPTSGTKQMSVAATLAALDEEIGEIIFTVGERHDGVVRTGTERLVTFSTEQFFRERTLREAERLFQAGAYHGAALLLKQYGQAASDAHDLAACLREWQRLNYEEARQIAAGASAPGPPPAAEPRRCRRVRGRYKCGTKLASRRLVFKKDARTREEPTLDLYPGSATTTRRRGAGPT